MAEAARVIDSPGPFIGATFVAVPKVKEKRDRGERESGERGGESERGERERERKKERESSLNCVSEEVGGGALSWSWHFLIALSCSHQLCTRALP